MSDTEQTIKILAIESSCDETAAAVVVNGRDMRSNVISSQIALHTLYGGVVPEIASRKHIEKINQVIAQALSDADMTLQDMDAIGVTYGPGLVGALLVGVAEAKAISYAANIPLVGVHHIEGHISANYIENPDLKPPFLCLVVSGGHTHLVKVTDYGTYEILGRTRDDAAGEAFDKVARAIGLGYPGGPKIASMPCAAWRNTRSCGGRCSAFMSGRKRRSPLPRPVRCRTRSCPSFFRGSESCIPIFI